MDPTKRHFVSRKLHSLLGILPLGAFILEHLFTNGFILGGQLAYDRQVNWLLSLPKPILWTLEIVFIALPLLFHGILGVKIVLEGKGNAAQYPYARNFAYTLQRFSGVYLLGFIIYHVWTTRFAGHFEYPARGPAFDAQGALVGTSVVGDGAALVGTKSSIYYFMVQSLSGNWLLGLVYMLGVAAAAFHFGNGLWTFCITWGITVGKRAQRVSRWIFSALGVGLFVLGAATVIHLVLARDPLGA
jgi:succinate dehydrogenase/fumarate reductase cytochrome b subunit (b558 family)